jgi:hypothetical protein
MVDRDEVPGLEHRETRGTRRREAGFHSAFFQMGCELGFEGKYPSRVRLRAPLAPSLTGHRMLPRITQKSNSAALRRESQIEPWLAISQPTACRREDGARNHPTQMLREIRSTLQHQALPSQRGLDVRKNLPGNGEKCFLLTSPFIEPVYLLLSMTNSTVSKPLGGIFKNCDLGLNTSVGVTVTS